MLSVAAIGAGMLVSSSILEHPRPTTPLLRDADPSVDAIVRRSCQDCHSERTHWPWYAQLPPASTLLQHDVATARHHMNLSHWDDYNTDEKQRILKQISAMVRSGSMPPRRYLLMHPSAHLSAEESRGLQQWARSERHKLH